MNTFGVLEFISKYRKIFFSSLEKKGLVVSFTDELYHFSADEKRISLDIPEDILITSHEKIIAIIPPPRKNLIRFFGVFGPHHKNREEITNMVRRRPIHISEIGKIAEPKKVISETEKIDTIEVIPIKPTYWIPWADLLKKTFNFDALKCEKCGCTMKVANLVTKPNEIKKILLSLDGIDTVNTPILSVDPPLEGYVYIPDYEHRE